MAEHLLIMHHLHCASTKDIRRSHHEWIAYFLCDDKSFTKIAGHSRFRMRYTKLSHHLSESVTVFSKVDCLRSCSKNFHTCPCQFTGNIERSLSSKLNDNAFRFFFLVDTEHIFNSKWFKVEFIRGIIIC